MLCVISPIAYRNLIKIFKKKREEIKRIVANFLTKKFIIPKYKINFKNRKKFSFFVSY